MKSSMATMARTPIHPGERLAEELREHGITADTALRLAHWFGTSPKFWMNLQQLYELRHAESEIGVEIAALPRGPRRATLRQVGLKSS